MVFGFNRDSEKKPKKDPNGPRRQRETLTLPPGGVITAPAYKAPKDEKRQPKHRA